MVQRGSSQGRLDAAKCLECSAHADRMPSRSQDQSGATGRATRTNCHSRAPPIGQLKYLFYMVRKI